MDVSMFFCGDVMTGRGIDQILPDPADPVLYEPFVKDARDYRYLAEQKNGPVPAPVPFQYIWGQALNELNRRKTDLRIINLETSITSSNDYWKGKGINYKMNPQNIACLSG
ncbi:MAG: poly-gamma-glutamate biosynthesis protein, partial [Fibrobacter sp.]|nr:poly-gamma-glutamate biosynthesis protein [Fibrobacter sp.]